MHGSHSKLEELQLERLRDVAVRCYENIPLYKQRFDEAGVDPYHIESLEDIKKFPFTVKQDMRDAYPFGLFAVPRSECVRVHASSGTTGQATVVGYTKDDLQVWGDCFARGISMLGGGEDSVVQVSYGYGLFTGGLGAHFGAEAAGAMVVPMSTGNTKRQIQIMKDFGVTILCATPSYALLIADTIAEMGMSMDEFKLTGVILGAEPCSESTRDEIRRKAWRAVLRRVWPFRNHGPGRCHGVLRGERLAPVRRPVPSRNREPRHLRACARRRIRRARHYHAHAPVHPLIRYRTRDLTRFIPGECACGRTHKKIDRIVGRTDDMLIIRGVNVFPSQIEQVVSSFDEITPHYQIVLTTKGTLDQIELRVETAPDFPFDEIRALEDLKKRLAAALKSNLQIAVKIKFCEPKTIERSEGKSKRVIDLREVKRQN